MQNNSSAVSNTSPGLGLGTTAIYLAPLAGAVSGVISIYAGGIVGLFSAVIFCTVLLGILRKAIALRN